MPLMYMGVVAVGGVVCGRAHICVSQRKSACQLQMVSTLFLDFSFELCCVATGLEIELDYFYCHAVRLL